MFFFSKTQNKSESTSVPKQTCSQSAVRGVSTHDARRERSSGGCCTLVVVEERPPPPTHTHECKALWVYSNKRKALYKCIIHSFIYSSVHMMDISRAER